jgi:hypothetical protein
MEQLKQETSRQEERRMAPRKTVDYDIRFSVTNIEFGIPFRVEAEGKIINLSERGFGLLTTYPLQKGHVITIKHDGDQNIPSYGLVKWIRKLNDHYQVGLGFRYKD